MAIFLGIVNFIFGAIGVFSTCLFILSCINSVVNPTFPDGNQDGNSVSEKYDKLRLFLVIVMSISWGIVIAL